MENYEVNRAGVGETPPKSQGNVQHDRIIYLLLPATVPQTYQLLFIFIIYRIMEDEKSRLLQLLRAM